MNQCFGNTTSMCEEQAVYILHTQFAGSLPLCEKHAKEDNKFMVTDSYTSWEKLDES